MLEKQREEPAGLPSPAAQGEQAAAALLKKDPAGQLFAVTGGGCGDAEEGAVGLAARVPLTVAVPLPPAVALAAREAEAAFEGVPGASGVGVR
jgi:hypothetical protein